MSENMLAYHLATERKDRVRALALARSLERSMAKKVEIKETVAWVYLRFSVVGTKSWERGCQLYWEFLDDPALDDDLRTDVKKRFEALFGTVPGISSRAN
jgi:hypothetical protein